MLKDTALPHLFKKKLSHTSSMDQMYLDWLKQEPGKTAAFAIPILQLLSREKQLSNVSRNIKCLILTPTRELAIQIEENITQYGAKLWLKHCVIFGWVKQNAQVKILQRGVDILVATPGRLLDLISQWYIDLKKVEIFTLDEADRMLNMWFIHDVKKILTHLPAKKQTLFFSATMPKEISGLANEILNNPVKVTVTPVSSTAEKVQQTVFYVSKNDKKNLLIDLLNTIDMTSILVFTRTKHGANKLVTDLEKAGVPAKAIHGNKSQNNRQRALADFKSKEIRVLVATDIAARGIDIDDLPYVVNYDIPNEPETYVHRIGRTGRAWKEGIAISFCNHEEFEYLLDVQKLIWKQIEVDDQHPYAIKIDGPMPKSAKKKQGGRGGSRGWNASWWKRPAVARRKQNVKRNRGRSER